jgi:hypothetical protein
MWSGRFSAHVSTQSPVVVATDPKASFEVIKVPPSLVVVAKMEWGG